MPVDDFTPSPQDVAAIDLARTADSLGNLTGTFNEDTRPTNDQAALIIDNAVKYVAPMIGTDIPSVVWDKAQNVIALYAAALIEVSLYGQEIRNGISPYPYYIQMFEKALPELQNEIIAIESGLDPSDQAGGDFPYFSFPPADNLLFGEM